MSITVGRVQVEVIPSTENFAKKLKVALAAIGDVAVQVDVDTAAAKAKLEALVKGPWVVNVRTDVDTRAAEARLRHLARNRVATIRVRTVGGGPSGGGGGAGGRNGVGGIRTGLTATALGTAIAVLPTIAPIAAAATAAIAAIGPAAVVAAAGLGVLIGAFSGVGTALTALKAARKAEATDAKAALTAQTGAANLARTAAESLRNARDRAGDAARNQAAIAGRVAHAIVQAERDVIDAQRDSQRAIEDLIDARRQAQEQLEDIASRRKNAELDERQAVLDLAQAEFDLANVRADPLATTMDSMQAQLDYERAVQNLADLREANQDVVTEARDMEAAGVEGNQAVQDAAYAAAQAQQTVVDATHAQAEAIRDGLLANAEAQRDVVEAGQYVEEATVRLAEAQQHQVDVNNDLSASAEAVKHALAELGPSARTFVAYVDGTMRPALWRLRDAAADGVLPGVTALFDGLLRNFTGLEAFVRKVGEAIGGGFAGMGAALDDPRWQPFFDYINRVAVPAIDGMFTAFENISRGLGSIMVAFEPLTAMIGQGFVTMTERFAAWAAGLETNPGFQRFVAYVRENGPLLMSTLGSIALAILAILEALAPLAPYVLTVVDALARFVAAIPTPVLTVFLGVLIPVVATLTSLFGVLTTISGVMALFGSGGILAGVGAGLAGVAGSVAVVVAAVAGLVLWIKYVIDNWEAFYAVEARVGNAILDSMRNVADWIRDKWNGLLDFFRSLPRFFSLVGQQIAGALMAPIDAIRNSRFGKAIASIDIPLFANGGIVTKPTLGIIGEAGPEAVIPLSGRAGVSPLAPAMGQAAAPEVRVFIGNEELTSRFRTEIVRYDNDSARQYAYGRRP